MPTSNHIAFIFSYKQGSITRRESWAWVPDVYDLLRAEISPCYTTEVTAKKQRPTKTDHDLEDLDNVTRHILQLWFNGIPISMTRKTTEPYAVDFQGQGKLHYTWCRHVNPKHVWVVLQC